MWHVYLPCTSNFFTEGNITIKYKQYKVQYALILLCQEQIVPCTLPCDSCNLCGIPVYVSIPKSIHISPSPSLVRHPALQTPHALSVVVMLSSATGHTNRSAMEGGFSILMQLLWPLSPKLKGKSQGLLTVLHTRPAKENKR